MSRKNGADLTDYPGFIKNLKGGFEHSGLVYAQSLVTGKPLFGVYLTNLHATTLVSKDGTAQPIRHNCEPYMGVEMEAMAQAAEQVCKTFLKALQRPSVKGAQSVGWAGAPIVFSFDVAYMISPEQLVRVKGP